MQGFLIEVDSLLKLHHIFRHGTSRHAHCLPNGIVAHAPALEPAHLLNLLLAFSRRPHLHALRHLAGHAGLGALAQAHPLLLGQRGQYRDDGLFEQPGRVEVLLGKRLEAHAPAFELVQVLERRQRPLAAEAVEAPEQHQVEAPPVGIGKQRLELRALPGTG